MKDERGVLSLIVIVLVVGIIVVAGVVAAMVVVVGGDGWRPPNYDMNGDGKEDPTIGWIDVDAVIEMDNSQWFSDMELNIESVKASAVMGNPPTMDFLTRLGKMLDLSGHSDELKVEFVITMPSDPNFKFVDQVYLTMNCDPGERVLSNPQSPDEIPTIRYHGSYIVVVNIYNMTQDGKMEDSMTVSVEA